jgi:cell division protein FtsI/penicillin-binding protein 2
MTDRSTGLISPIIRVVFLVMVLGALALPGEALTAKARSKKRATGARTAAKSYAAASSRTVPIRRVSYRTSYSRGITTGKKRRAAYSPWSAPTYADSTMGDNPDGEDLEVRRAAVGALGPLNGSIVVVDPNTGRVLSMVNQRLALGNGYTPCSTIKIPVALAALSEGLIERTTRVKLSRYQSMDLTQALAKSNNPYFAVLGEKLGYERVAYYAHLFGLGEKAGLDIAGEQPGAFPSGPPKVGGMGLLTSYGMEVSLTPLQLAAFVSAIANGGTLYYLQYPRTEADLAAFTPRVKRRLDIESLIPEVKPGMMGAVQYGTARRIQAITDEPIFGKTGTCSEDRTHLGWFGSFTEVGQSRLVVAVLLTGGRPSVGPAAAAVAGEVYKRLSDIKYFERKETQAASAGSPAPSSTGSPVLASATAGAQ